MCGYLGNVTDSPLTRVLLDYLGMGDQLQVLADNPGRGPASSIDIVLESEQGRRIQSAIWWLLLEGDGQGGFKPSRYASFNTRSDRLDEKRSAGFRPFRQARCIVPATYFIEGDGPKGGRRYHRVEPDGCAFALGGLYRSWVHQGTGELTYSCSVITLPPHPDVRWRQVHGKSTPLMLPLENGELVARWLDPQFHRVEEFRPLLQPRFPQPIRCVPVNRPGDQRVVGEAFEIAGDRENPDASTP
jgi:putative SOS response-associated peptidase YedK